MALLMKLSGSEQTPKPVEPVKTGFQWSTWYAQNKVRLSEKRAKRYAEDPEYREAALTRSRHQREIKKEPVTDGYTVSFNDTARALDVSVWVLREWRRKSYFPEPFRREGRLWFKPAHIPLLQSLHTFFQEHGIRVGESKRRGLDETVQLVWANW